MTQYTVHHVKHKSRHVVVTVDGSRVTARLYLNNGDTPSLQAWAGKTTAGANRWARKVLSQ